MDSPEPTLNPMCEIGRGMADWHGHTAKCNRRADVNRSGRWWCSKHDPARLRVVAAYERATTLQRASTEDLRRELARRGEL